MSTLMSLNEWREARKKFLIQFLIRRLFSLEELEQEDVDTNNNDIEADDNDNDESERRRRRRRDNNGGNNNKCDDAENDEEEEEEDACSFSSGVLDEPFFCVGTTTTTTTTTEHYSPHDDDADNSNNIGDGVVVVELAVPDDDDKDEEEEEDSIQLQTQPLLMAEKRNTSNYLVDELLTGGHASSSSSSSSGIKRKLGFGDTYMEHGESDANDDDDNTTSQQQLETQPQNHHYASVLPPRGEEQQQQQQRQWISSKKQRRARKRCLMWDGNFQAIPHIINDATSTSTTLPCSKLGELDLSSTSLNLSLCRILRVWDLRLTKRMDKLVSPRSGADGGGGGGRDGSICESTTSLEARQYHPSSCTIMPHEFYEDDGPLNIAYKRVFSIEVSQINAGEDEIDDDNNDDNDLQGHNNLTSPSIANLTMAAFHDGDTQLKRVQSRKRRHAIRRIRIYFYNKYADAMSNALRDLWGECKHISSRGRNNSKLTSLLSLANVPARCIFPYLIATPSNGSPPPPLHPHVQHYVMNPMGDDDFGVVSPFCICIGDESNLSLDVQQRLFFDCESLGIRLLVDAPSSNQDPLVDNVDGAGDSFCVDFEDTVVTVTSNSANSGGYVKDVKRSRLPRNFGQRLRWKRILDLTAVSNDVAYDGVDEVPNANMALPVGAGANNDGNANETIEIGPTAESAAAGVRRVRKTPALTVTPLRELHPLLLRNNMKKLNDTVTVYGVVLGFTPPSLTSTQEWKMSIVLIDETLPLPDWALDTRNISEEDKPREMHVPSVTLLLFMKDKSKLPVIRSAGDVICCEKVVLQAWSGEPQLCSKKHVSKFVVVRSGQTSFPDHPGIDLSRAQNLWSWGQQRLSEHPTMSPNCHLSIAGLGCGSDNAEVCEPGDLTAAVTAIIAMPEHLRRRDTPRGFIRLWDGTGPSRSDSLPLDAAEIGAMQPHDPPEQVLLEIDKIIGNLVESGTSIEAPLTLCGRVVNAIVWEEELWNLIHKENILCVGTFVRLRNVNNAKLQTGVCNGE
ncbi:hypothetical protein ACHAWU_005013 [Discostella pseudostelligera]|uniref:Telomeric single stranded DNA binding POT1/Cdc13 domain-containing protein n=1 Tax=Discostella pseudostelligera TaxID=259834 RepID=A0ABD3M2Y8_9STRA